MDLFANYGSDASDGSDEGEGGVDERPSPRGQPEPTTEKRGKREDSHRQPRQLGAKKSRWAQSSAFLAPVAYDKGDVDEADAGDDDDDDDDAGPAPRPSRPAAGGRTGPDVARLRTLLPAPVNERKDKNAPGANASGATTGAGAGAGAGATPLPGGSAGGSATATVKANAASRAMSFAPTIDAAPTVGGPRAHAHRPNSYPDAPTTDVQLPAGVVVKELTATELRGPPGAGSSQDLEAQFRADAARNSAIPKTAKRKNQLSALLEQAKATAEEHREKRASGANIRNATKNQYGW
jgi:hypothetical protein